MVDIAEGSEISGIDVVVKSFNQTYSITGRLVEDFTGEPIREIACAVKIYSGDKQIGGISGMNFSDKNGEFVIDNLPPGRYSITVPSQLGPAGLPPPQVFGESEPFEVIDKDLTGIVVKAFKTSSVSGTVVIEGSVEMSAGSKLKDIRLNVISAKIGSPISIQRLAPGPDGTFAASGLRPGKLSISLSLLETGESQPFRLKRLEFNGAPQLKDIELQAGQNIAGLKVVLAYATGGIRGVIKNQSGALPSVIAGTAMLYSENSVIAGTFVDARGVFLFDNIPAGNYRLVVTVGTPSTTKRSGRSEQMITVNDDTMSDVVVLIDLPTGSSGP